LLKCLGGGLRYLGDFANSRSRNRLSYRQARKRRWEQTSVGLIPAATCPKWTTRAPESVF